MNGKKKKEKSKTDDKVLETIKPHHKDEPRRLEKWQIGTKKIS